MNPEQLKAALRRAGYVVASEGGGGYGPEPGDPFIPGPTTYYYYGPRGRTDAREAAAASGIPEAMLTSMESQLVATPEESSSLYPSRGGGFFSMLTDLVTSPQFLMAGSVIAPSILAAGGAGAGAASAAGAAGAAAPVVEPGMLSSALGGASPASTAFPVATSPLATLAEPGMGAANLLASDAAGLAAPVSGNALAPVVEPGMLSSTVGGANALAPVVEPGMLSSTVGAGTPAATGVGMFDPASAMETQLTAAPGTPAAVSPAAAATAANAGSNALAGYGGAGDVLDPVTGVVTAGTDAATGLSAGAFDTLAKFAKDYGVPLASLLSGITGSQAAKSAADVQAQSAREARDLAKQIYEKQVSLQEPFRTAGITAQNQLLTLLGLPGGTQGAEYGKYARPFSMQDFQADPGYAFRLSEGMKALEASRAAKSGLLSGSAIKAGMRYGQEMGLQEYGNAFQRAQIERANRLQPLGSLAGMGQAAAAGQAGYAGQYGQTAGGLTTDIGAARAAGDVGAANAITNALGQYARYASGQNLANQIRQSAYGPAILIG